MWSKVRPAWWVLRREVRDQFRDWRITIPIILLTLVFPFIMNFMADRVVAFVSQYGAQLISERLIPFFLLIVGFFPISISLVIALESFVGEKERGSIEPLLSSPLKDWQLYLGKLIAVMVPPLTAAYIGIVVYLYGAYKEFKWVAEPGLLVLILTLTLVQAFVMVSAAVVVSTQATTVRASNLLASFIIIPVAFLIQGESIVMFWGNYHTLWWAVFGLLVISVLLVRTGISHFNREELLGRELDILDFKWMWSVLKSQFIGQANSLGNWYFIELRQTLKSMRIPFFLMIILFIGAGYIGINLASTFVIPPNVFDLENLNFSVFEEYDAFSFLSSTTVFYIWFHNLRTILISTLVGVFSFGILGVITLLLPIGLIAYFMVPAAGAGIPEWKFFTGFVLPHGIIEIPVILLAGATILRIGARLIAPNAGESIGEGLLRSLADWAKIMVGYILPLLLAAAILETYVTPKIALWLLNS
jgi:uncharacterized membrane protein SpoIIM required for sporulation/ABC-type transport system involved in multi-copper enzyme maturation permease subunit